MKRFALITATTTALMVGAAAQASMIKLGALEGPTARTIKTGHWEYRTFTIPVYEDRNENNNADHTVIGYRYETRRVWVQH